MRIPCVYFYWSIVLMTWMTTTVHIPLLTSSHSSRSSLFKPIILAHTLSLQSWSYLIKHIDFLATTLILLTTFPLTYNNTWSNLLHLIKLTPTLNCTIPNTRFPSDNSVDSSDGRVLVEYYYTGKKNRISIVKKQR